MSNSFTTVLHKNSFTAQLSFLFCNAFFTVPATVDTGCTHSVISLRDMLNTASENDIHEIEDAVLDICADDANRFSLAFGMIYEQRDRNISVNRLREDKNVRYHFGFSDVYINSCSLGDITMNLSLYGHHTLIGMDLLKFFNINITPDDVYESRLIARKVKEVKTDFNFNTDKYSIELIEIINNLRLGLAPQKASLGKMDLEIVEILH